MPAGSRRKRGSRSSRALRSGAPQGGLNCTAVMRTFSIGVWRSRRPTMTAMSCTTRLPSTSCRRKCGMLTSMRRSADGAGWARRMSSATRSCVDLGIGRLVQRGPGDGTDARIGLQPLAVLEAAHRLLQGLVIDRVGQVGAGQGRVGGRQAGAQLRHARRVGGAGLEGALHVAGDARPAAGGGNRAVLRQLGLDRPRIGRQVGGAVDHLGGLGGRAQFRHPGRNRHRSRVAPQIHPAAQAIDPAEQQVRHRQLRRAHGLGAEARRVRGGEFGRRHAVVARVEAVLRQAGQPLRQPADGGLGGIRRGQRRGIGAGGQGRGGGQGEGGSREKRQDKESAHGKGVAPSAAKANKLMRLRRFIPVAVALLPQSPPASRR